MTTHNLPAQSTAFVGRSTELAVIAERLADPLCRLLTVLGPGGIGKTRLAVQAAANQIARFAHGVYFVPLAPVRSPDLLAAAIASALNVSFYDSEKPNSQIDHYLREKRILLVMDNFEHLLEGTGLLTDILNTAPAVKILATSRERLNLQEEWVFTLDGLAYPQGLTAEPIESYSAVQLFAQRARQVQASFSLDENVQPVIAICQQVEGMPLGLELAASWLRLMPCEQIAAQLARNLDFLATPLRNVPERHRSLRAVFDQSWSLLSDAERSALMKLSVFRGGFDLQAAEKVASAPVPILAGLADKSLVRLSPVGRYDLHELLRQYAADKLAETGEAVATANQHLSYFLNQAERAEAELNGPQQIAWLDRLELEHDNLRAALAWSLSGGDAEMGLRLAGALGWSWIIHAQWSEARKWYTGLLAANASAPASVQAKALHRAAEMENYLGDSKQGMIFAEQALQLARAADDKWNTAWSLATLGLPAFIVCGAGQLQCLFS